MSRSGTTTETPTSSEVSTNSKTSLQHTANQKLLIDQTATRDQAVIIADTGAGKTTILLHVIEKRQQKFIVAAPPKVVGNWGVEAKKWGSPLKVVALIGNQNQRAALMQQDYDVLVVSLNNLDWLLKQPHGCTGILVDELSKAAGKQTTALKRKLTDQLTTRYGMTATPVSENFEKLYSMFRIIDKGATFGTRKDAYFAKYFYAKDYRGYDLALREGAEAEIMEKAAPLLLHLDYVKARELPKKTEQELVFDMPADTRKLYDQMREDLLVETSSDSVATAPNLAVLSSKLRQLASGFIMDEDSQPKEFDNARAVAATKFIESVKAPTLVIYEYDYQRTALERSLSVPFVSVYGGSDRGAIDKFKRGEVEVIIAQFNTLSHGVDGLQHICSNLLFYQPIWSADATEQSIGRIWRQGQTEPVTVSYLICDATLDDVVMSRVKDKKKYMKMFMEHLKNG